MSKFVLFLALLGIVSLAAADTLTVKVNKVAFDYATAMFGAAQVSAAECSAEEKEATGFFFRCGQTALEDDAFEAAWAKASREYGSADADGTPTADDAWSSVGSGEQGLETFVDGEFVTVSYGPDGDVTVRSGQTY